MELWTSIKGYWIVSISYTLFPLVFGQKGLCQDQTVSDCTDGRLIWFLLPLYIEET